MSEQTFESYGAVLGRALDAQQSGRLADAQAGFEQAIALDPRQAPAHFHLACLLQTTGRLDQAAISYRTAATLAPEVAMVHVNFGACRHALGQLAEAVESFERAVALSPSMPEAHANLGLALQDLGRLAEAEANLRRAVSLRPEAAMFHSNLGTVLRDQGRLDEALASFERALALDPNSALALVNIRLARSATEDGDAATELAAYRRLLRINPHFAVGQSKLLMAMNYIPGMSAADLSEAHREFGRCHARPAAAIAPHMNSRDSGRRLRVGYVSPDFRTHSCAYFAGPLLRAHDRSQVEIFAYAEIGKADAMTDRIRGSVDGWRITTGLFDDSVAAMVREDKIDILVDLAGHTSGNRLGVFARKPAPIQVTWLGYPATTGLGAIDYRLTDAVADPVGADSLATEQLIRLPGGFLCYAPLDDMPAVSALPARRRGGVTFGSFNSALKINADVIAVWARLLRAVAGSRLILKGFHVDAGHSRQRLEALLVKHGVAGRVELRAPAADMASHLSAYAEVDLALDTFPYNGTMTTCEALWLGVPTVTLRGDRHAGRVGASLLAAAGLGELVAETPDEYVRKAAATATDLDRLDALRAGLRNRVQNSRLADAAGFARSVEAAYRDMWRRWCGTAA